MRTEATYNSGVRGFLSCWWRSALLMIGGVLILGEGVTLTPLLQGGNGVFSLSGEMPELPPERYEAGTLPTPAIAGLLFSHGPLPYESELSTVECHTKKALNIVECFWFGVIRTGFEPVTHSLEGCCSIQLSYRTSPFNLLPELLCSQMRAQR